METPRMLKDLAARAFSQKKYQDALKLYSHALQQVTQQQGMTAGGTSTSSSSEAAVLNSNIAAVLIKLDKPEESLLYATAATQLDPSWPKGFYRQALALQALQQHTAAAAALETALGLAEQGTPEAAELSAKLEAASVAANRQQQHAATQQGLLAGHTAWAKNRAREAGTRAALTQQLQQGMAGYAWEPEDWEWRLTWTPSMRTAAAAAAAAAAAVAVNPSPTYCIAADPTTSTTSSSSAGSSLVPAHASARTLSLEAPSDRATAAAAAGRRLLSALEVPPGSTQQQQDQIKQLLAQLTLSLAELEAPQRGLRLVQDQPLLNWYQQSITAAVAATAVAAADAGDATGAAAECSGPTVLVLANGGGGLLGLMAAAAGAGKVVVVEKWRWGCRASRQLLEANRKAHPQLVSKIELVPGPLSSCYYEPVAAVPADAATVADVADGALGAVGVVSAGDTGSSAIAEEAEGIGQQPDMVVQVVGLSLADKPKEQQSFAAPSLSPTAKPAAAAVGDGSRRSRMLTQADVLVTDMFDYSVLGQGVLGAIQSAAAAGLASPSAVMVPDRVTVKGQLVNSLLSQRVSGFDLTAVNRYKWHPTMEHIELERYHQLQPASYPVTLQKFNLGTVADSSSSSSTVSTILHAGCSADALAVWVELKAADGLAVSTGPTQATSATTAAVQQLVHSSGMGLGLYYLDSPIAAKPARHTVPSAGGPAAAAAAAGVSITTRCSPAAVRLAFDVCAQQDLKPCHCSGCAEDVRASDGPASSSRKRSTPTTTTTSSSSSRSLTAPRQLPASATSTGGVNMGILKCVEGSRQASWSPHGFPRHAWLPRWHFDMLADAARNDTYEAALRRAIANLRASTAVSADSSSSSRNSRRRVHVLDLGAGTGLLSMLAIRCGADAATAVESVRHMADTANQVLSINMMPNIEVVHKDARYLSSDDIKAAGDLLVFEVFDCGCIGEGALHIVASARKHLKPGARILPASAQVYCQPIQYGNHIEQRANLPYDTTFLAPYAWQPDYFEADLKPQYPAPVSVDTTGNTTSPNTDCTSSSSSSSRTSCTNESQQAAAASATAQGPSWKPLAPAQPVFHFDFNTPDPLTAFQPAEQQLQFSIDTPGVLNAVAFWFELQLDEQTSLSSSPYVAQTGLSTTWKQAVQLLPEHAVQPGQVATLTASHDTYTIAFTLPVNTNTTTPPTTRAPAPAAPAAAATDAEHQASAFSNTPIHTGAPLSDPAWRAAYSQLTALQSQLVKSIAQDPLEHRRVAAAALQLAMQPWTTAGGGEGQPGQQQQQQGGADLVADPHHAAALLTRLMA